MVQQGYAYDDADRLTYIAGVTLGSPDVWHVERIIGHDAVGNRTFVRNLVSGEEDRSELYAYDGLNRLRGVQRGELNGAGDAIADPPPAGVLATEDWTSLDTNGNWLSWSWDKQLPGGGADTFSETRVPDTSGTNAITTRYPSVGTQVGLSYDPAGNLTNDGEFVYEYDGHNRLIRVSEGMVVRLRVTYDALGRVASRNLGDSNPTTYYFYDGSNGFAVANQNDRFITAAETEKILDACPDTQWRLLFGLARFGGLRVPSETHSLRWADVLWDQHRMVVRSPKTEHHDGHSERVVPIFPELMSFLQEAFDEAEPGEERVVTLSRNNLHRSMKSIIKRPGLAEWPALFQTLRSTRQTELVQAHPEHAVNAWIGNSRAVAHKHYLQVTDDMFDRAAGIEALQNPMQHSSEMSRTNAKDDQHADDDDSLETCGATTCTSDPLRALGLEPRTYGLKGQASVIPTGCAVNRLQENAKTGAAKSDAILAELQEIVAAWAALPDPFRRAIMAIVRSVIDDKGAAP